MSLIAPLNSDDPKKSNIGKRLDQQRVCRRCGYNLEADANDPGNSAVLVSQARIRKPKDIDLTNQETADDLVEELQGLRAQFDALSPALRFVQEHVELFTEFLKQNAPESATTEVTAPPNTQ